MLWIAKTKKIRSCGRKLIMRVRNPYPSARKALKRRGVRPEETSQCEHDAPILVLSTEAGYCAQCLVCLKAEPDHPTAKEARKALLGATSRY